MWNHFSLFFFKYSFSLLLWHNFQMKIMILKILHAVLKSAVHFISIEHALLVALIQFCLIYHYFTGASYYCMYYDYSETSTLSFMYCRYDHSCTWSCKQNVYWFLMYTLQQTSFIKLQVTTMSPDLSDTVPLYIYFAMINRNVSMLAVMYQPRNYLHLTH